jgi:hypothetical protein
MVPYWVGQSRSQGMFPKKTLSRPCSEYEVVLDEVLLGMGFLTYQGLPLSHLWVPLWRVHCIPSFAMQHFSKPFICLSFFMVQTLSVICNGKKRSTAMPL